MASASRGGCSTSAVITTSSNAQRSPACLRFTSCFMAVRNPCSACSPFIGVHGPRSMQLMFCMYVFEDVHMLTFVHETSHAAKYNWDGKAERPTLLPLPSSCWKSCREYFKQEHSAHCLPAGLRSRSASRPWGGRMPATWPAGRGAAAGPGTSCPAWTPSQLPASHSAGMRALNSASSASISGPLSATVPAPHAQHLKRTQALLKVS